MFLPIISSVPGLTDFFLTLGCGTEEGEAQKHPESLGPSFLPLQAGVSPVLKDCRGKE